MYGFHRLPTRGWPAILPILLALLGPGCGPGAGSSGSTADARPEVAVSVLPLAGIVDRLLPAGAAEVSVLVPAGASPHFFEPGVEQLARVQRSRLVLELGHPAMVWETSWLDALLADSDAVRVRLVEGCDLLEDDPHVWLDPGCLPVLSARTAEALGRVLPESRGEIEARLAAFLVESQRLEASLRELLADRRGRAFLVQHPAWAYFARAFGLEQVSVMPHGGGDGGSARLAAVIDRARTEEIRAVFVQPQVNPAAAETVAEALGVPVRELDPLLRDPLEALQRTAAAVLEATGGE